MENVTKGEFYNNLGFVTDKDNGISIAEFSRIIDADLACDAFNTYKTTGLTPSQLLEQNMELVEFIQHVSEMTSYTEDSYLHNKSRELLTKHQKDV